MTRRRVRLTGWNRLRWGVVKDCKLLDAGWYAPHDPAYEGEPPRPLLFLTRLQARRWCLEQHAKYFLNYPDGHVCRTWRFRVVRVRERITATKGTT